MHWLTAIAIAILIPTGLWMVSRGSANLWDTLTNTLYAWHKAIGFTTLWLIVARLCIKVRHQTPDYGGQLSARTLMAVKIIHRLMYVLLICVPILGWAGITAYPALDTIAGYNLPAMPFIPKSEALAKQIFSIHAVLAITLGVLALGHIAAAFKHLLIDRDNIFQRMWFK
jgi:cytochrome b561